MSLVRFFKVAIAESLAENVTNSAQDDDADEHTPMQHLGLYISYGCIGLILLMSAHAYFTRDRVAQPVKRHQRFLP
jgi:hypothetical protein